MLAGCVGSVFGSQGGALFAVAAFAEHLDVSCGVAAALFKRDDVIELDPLLAAAADAPPMIAAPDEDPHVLRYRLTSRGR